MGRVEMERAELGLRSGSTVGVSLERVAAVSLVRIIAVSR